MARTEASQIGIFDEGITILAAANSLNFAGAGVTVTDAGNGRALVTIPGGGSPISTNLVTPGGTTDQLDDFEVTLEQVAVSVDSGLADITDIPSKAYLERQLTTIRNDLYQLG